MCILYKYTQYINVYTFNIHQTTSIWFDHNYLSEDAHKDAHSSIQTAALTKYCNNYLRRLPLGVSGIRK